MSILYTILGTLIALGVLVTIHEYGHFWTARRCGVKVLRFSVGFGKPLLRCTITTAPNSWWPRSHWAAT